MISVNKPENEPAKLWTMIEVVNASLPQTLVGHQTGGVL